MRYVTHQFAHVETLERARRWLVQVGIDPIRIEARTRGILNLAVAAEGGESAEVQRIFDVAESADPDGNPGIWYRAARPRAYPGAETATRTDGIATRPHSFVVGWHPPDADRDVSETDAGVERQKRHHEQRG